MGQELVQYGMVREQNSRRRPIGGVVVIYEGATPTASDDSGKFRLVFNNKRPGEYIFLVEVQKKGYEVVNMKEIEQIILSSSEQINVDIVLAKTGLLDFAKKEYYSVSNIALLSNFEKEKKALREKFQKAILNGKDFENQLTGLEEQYDRHKSELDALADKFARVNFDDVDQVYEDALILFKAGEIEKAIATLDEGNLLQRTEMIIKERKRINKVQSGFNEQKILFEKEQHELVESMLLLADLYSLQVLWDKVDELFSNLLLLDSTNIKVLEKYSSFLTNQNLITKGIEVTEKLIDLKKNADTTGNSIDENLTHDFNRLGTLYASIGNFEKANHNFINALESWRIENPDSLTTQRESYIYRMREKAIVLNNYGILNFDLKKYSESIQNYNDALSILLELSKIDSLDNSFKPNLADSYNGLGNIFIDFVSTKTEAYDYAFEYLKKSLEIFEVLLNIDNKNSDHLYMKAVCLNNLGLLDEKANKYGCAEIYYAKSLEILERLYETNKYKYRFEVVRTHIAIALLNNNIYQKESKSENALQKATTSFKKADKILDEDKFNGELKLSLKSIISKYLVN